MNSRTSSTLNPNAASYVPISRREVYEHNASNNVPGKSVDLSYDPSASADFKPKIQQLDAVDSVTSENSQDLADCKFMDEHSEMDLAYLQMLFPGVSDQSVADVYNVNSGDLDAAVDMLTHLESADNMPDSLNTQHPEEPVSSSECSSVKAVNVTGESNSSNSSARPSDLGVAT